MKPRDVTYVQQEDANGCGVACLAMVTGQSYRDVKAWEGFVGKDFRGDGMTYHDLMQYLTDHGYATALRFRWLPGCSDTGHHTRNPWPTAPYAPAHIVSVRRGQHLVVLLHDGAVLDPYHPQPSKLADYDEVAWMLGVFDVRGEADGTVVRLREQCITISNLLAEAGVGAMPLVEGVRTIIERADASTPEGATR